MCQKDNNRDYLIEENKLEDNINDFDEKDSRNITPIEESKCSCKPSVLVVDDGPTNI